MFLFSNFKDVFFLGSLVSLVGQWRDVLPFFLGFMSKKKLIACYDSQHGGKNMTRVPMHLFKSQTCLENFGDWRFSKLHLPNRVIPQDL